MRFAASLQSNLLLSVLLSLLDMTRIYGPTPLARPLITDVRENHCSHISGLLMEDFCFLAPMV
ncbi:hypothetical protein, partial [Bowmanella yangjiangensis]